MFAEHQVHGVSRLFAEAKVSIHGMTKWISIIQHLWTSFNNNNILGSYIKFTLDDLMTHTIVCCLLKHNTTYGAKEVASHLQEMYIQ